MSREGGHRGLRGLIFLGVLLANMGINVLPSQQTVGHADQAFDGNDHLLDEAKNNAILQLGKTLALHLEKLKY